VDEPLVELLPPPPLVDDPPIAELGPLAPAVLPPPAAAVGTSSPTCPQAKSPAKPAAPASRTSVEKPQPKEGRTISTLPSGAPPRTDARREEDGPSFVVVIPLDRLTYVYPAGSTKATPGQPRPGVDHSAPTGGRARGYLEPSEIP